GLARAPERLLVNPGQHEDAAARRVLDDRRHELPGAQILMFHPASFSSAFSSGSRSGRSCTIDAMIAASAPTAKASARCEACPAPPEAITGTSTASATERVSGRS